MRNLLSGKKIFIFFLLFAYIHGADISLLHAHERQEQPDNKKLSKIREKAEKAYRKGHYPKATKLYQISAQMGDTLSIFIYGRSLLLGIGTESNPTEAISYLKKAAELEVKDAYYYLGECYINGTGVEKDKEESARWFFRSAHAGDVQAQYQLGQCYYFGRGIPKNGIEAYKWYLRAAEKGNASAQFSLGLLYTDGKTVPVDKEEALKWLHKAAEQGHQLAEMAIYTLENE